MKILLTAMIILISSCSSNQPQTDEQITASIKAKKAILKGALTPGTDKRCISMLSIFEFCYTRERTIQD